MAIIKITVITNKPLMVKRTVTSFLKGDIYSFEDITKGLFFWLIQQKYALAHISFVTNVT
jgi:hypothetical protein